MTTESCKGCGASHDEKKCPYCGRFAVNESIDVDADVMMQRMKKLAGIQCSQDEFSARKANFKKYKEPYVTEYEKI